MTAQRPGTRLALFAAAAVAVVALGAGLAAPALLGSVSSTEEAPAAATASPAEERRREALVADALALLAIDPERLGFEVVPAPPQPEVRAQIDLQADTITAFAALDDVAHRVAHDIAHELGHGLDRRLLDDADRDAYLAGRGAVDANWWPAEGEADYATGAGDFAEVFAACVAPSPDFRSTLAPAPPDPCALLPAEVLAERMGAS